MVGPDQPEDLRCSCKTKFADVTEKAITIGCRGCDQPVILPFAVLEGGDRVKNFENWLLVELVA